jgi:hypothetical protein
VPALVRDADPSGRLGTSKMPLGLILVHSTPKSGKADRAPSSGSILYDLVASASTMAGPGLLNLTADYLEKEQERFLTINKSK